MNTESKLADKKNPRKTMSLKEKEAIFFSHLQELQPKLKENSVCNSTHSSYIELDEENNSDIGQDSSVSATDYMYRS